MHTTCPANLIPLCLIISSSNEDSIAVHVIYQLECIRCVNIPSSPDFSSLTSNAGSLSFVSSCGFLELKKIDTISHNKPEGLLVPCTWSVACCSKNNAALQQTKNSSFSWTQRSRCLPTFSSEDENISSFPTKF